MASAGLFQTELVEQHIERAIQHGVQQRTPPGVTSGGRAHRFSVQSKPCSTCGGRCSGPWATTKSGP
jgi:hypothetical protein